MPETRSAHPVFSSGNVYFLVPSREKWLDFIVKKRADAVRFRQFWILCFPAGKLKFYCERNRVPRALVFAVENDWLSRICLKSTRKNYVDCASFAARSQESGIMCFPAGKSNIPMWRNQVRLARVFKVKIMISVYDNPNAMQIPLRNIMILVRVACDPELCEILQENVELQYAKNAFRAPRVF